MALAESLFTSQLYRENANVDTYMRLAIPQPFPSLPWPRSPRQTASFHLHLTSHPPSPSARNFVHKLFHGEIPSDRARLHFSASSLRPINSTGTVDFVPHIWHELLKFSRTLVRSLNLDSAKIIYDRNSSCHVAY